MKNLTFGLAFLVALILGFGSLAKAQDTKPSTDETAPVQRGEGFRKFKGEKGFGKMGGRHRGGDMMFGAIQQLNLTEDQRAQIKTIFDTNRQATQPQMEEMRNLMMQKRQGATLTPEQENRAQELRQQMHQNGKKLHEDILAVLTPEQRDQLKQMREEMRQKREQFRQQRRQQNPVPNTPPQTEN